MDLADDITYSVHDVEDFYKAGLIPLDLLNTSPLERERFCDAVFKREKGKLPSDENTLRETFYVLCDLWKEFVKFTGRFLQRQTLKTMSSTLIGDFVRSASLDSSSEYWHLDISEESRNQIYMLKQLTWEYVILNPQLRTLQHGQLQVIEQLFSFYLAELKTGDFSLFPPIYSDILDGQVKASDSAPAMVRTIIDMIASMTEGQAVGLCHRMSGVSLKPAFQQEW
jgi:dGTPase